MNGLARRQRGIVAVVVAISLVALLGMVGFALDSGHLILNKSRLQNTVEQVLRDAGVDGARPDDLRSIEALLAAYQSTWMPDVVSDAIAAVGEAAVPQLIELIETNPGILKRTTARSVIEELRSEALLAALLERAEAIAHEPDLVTRATALVDMVKSRAEVARAFGAKIFELRPDLAANADREIRALAKKAGLERLT